MVDTPGLRTHVATIGTGDPVVFLHGFPEHWWQWREVAARVAGGYRALCPDLRGAGWTQATSARVERLTRLRDLLALFDALEIDRAHLVSHDMGAITAMQMSYEHPERVRRHVQLSVPPAFLAMRPRLAPGFRHLPRFIWHRPGRSLRGIFAAPYLAHPLTAEEIDAHLAAMARPEIDAAVQPLTRRMILPEAMRLARGHYRRRRLTVPTRTVFGRRDWPWSEEAMRVCCPHPEKYADEYDFAYIEDAAHFITDDQPAEVADVVLDWLDRPDAGTTR
ncbi:alpha/beta fold hydrolase [Granulicoccus phenolivorans]|nr:alpha/beta hydrolase [Granulicoccus phenolivorans]